ncbi:MAG TPA: SpvB/TcaC N-terminal domain-containing protein, partial [Vicinamibacterales bacterium]|nr:SpvB/TcaC N-terminal domain-containing protein [Vicinamibacterales bacterium]
MANGSPESGGQAAARGSAPSISIPKSGGAVRDLGEKFEVNAVNGTSSLSVPIPVDGGRAGMKPTLTLAYNAASGNGPFGLGWDLSLPEITRKTDKGIPRYDDAGESDTFILSGVEDLVRVLVYDGHDWRPEWFDRSVDGVEYRVQRYRPRIEGLFARIERWTNRATGDVHWRSTTSENVTSIYGRTANSRISDPDDPSRCFRWLICESYDDTGNAIAFEYKRENSDGVDVAAAHEANRSERDRSANRYLKRIRYGNLAPTWDRIPPSDWMFEVVLDYGEHSPDAPRPAEEREWICRHDAFSSYRSSFEVRTYRLCQRILIFHHFPNEARVGADCLVRSMDLAYRGDAQRGEALGSFLASITERGYARRPEGDYIARAIPPLDLQYTEARIHDQIQDVDIESVENLPSGARAGYIWSDLDGEGLSGILSQQADAWFYKPNIGNARFGRVQVVSPVPSMAALESGRQQLMDVDSDGRIELVSLNPRIAGYYERGDPGWASFQTFHATPQIDWTDPNLRWIDLDGDGLSDVLITEDYAFIWYRSLGTEGFSAGRRVFQPSLDERQGPRLVFSDADRSIYLADMSGDGLSDLVRIRNGEVCYWPNLGYGRFGSKITMDRAPRFDMLDLFDQSRVRLADIDGSGTTDIIYLGRGGAFLFFNELGNRWTDARQLPMIPETHNIADVSAVDLFGNATTCLVWSSSEPSAAARPMRYIDLMGGTKPHLLARIDNNLGAERRLHYASSTRFYLADRRVGRPWITRLPFPVQVVERQILYDRVSRNQSQTRYRYHHGFYDGVEREFRGFGMVEQLDTEYEYALSGGDAALGNVDVTSNLPPVLAKTWFHVGDFQPQRGLTRGYEHEYYCEPGTTAAERQVMSLPDSTAPDDLTPEELREACRAMKSSVLRREVYAEDGSEKASRPYTVTEINYTIRLLQPFGPNRHASYFVHTRETVDFNYERAIFPTNDVPRPDPRVTHSIALAVDEYGNLLRSASLAYGRRFSDPELPPEARAAQQTTRVTLTIASFTNAVLDQDNYRLPATADSRTYELFNLRVPAVHPDLTNLVRFDDLYRRTRADSHGGHDLPYSDYTGSGAIGDGPYRRLIEESRTIYRRDDLSGPLPAGRLESLALPYADYQRSLTPELVLSVFGNRVSEDMLETGGYARLDGDAGWWKPSGRIFYSPVREDSPAEELEFARRHFFAPQRFENPFGNSTAVTYDRYTLLVQETRDALDNRTTAGERDREGAIVRQGNDYRVLKPWLVMDENRNRTEAAFDALGVVVVTAARGKPEEDLGDTIDGVDPDLPEEAVLRHLERPLVNPLEILGGATSRMVYDLFAYSRSRAAQQPLPSAIYTVARTIHRSELKPEQETHVIHTFTFV